MSLDDNRYDVVVIGGGFAGATAARDLTEQGNRVLLLEARDRLGGRTYSSTFPDSDVDIELGGQFILPHFEAAMREVERYGFAVDELPAPENVETILGGNRLSGMFPPLEQLHDIERAALHLIKSSMRIRPGTPMDHQDVADLDIPLSEFLAPLELAPETYDFVANSCSEYTFLYPAEQSALTALTYVALFEQSLATWLLGITTHTRTGALATRIAQDVTEVRLASPVMRVDQTSDDVIVTLATGDTVSTAAVVVATPVNIWNDIEFLPALSEVKRTTSAERHGGARTAKAALRVRNVAANTAIIGTPRSTGGGYQLYSEKVFANGDQLMNLFAWTSVEGDDYHLDLDERESVERVLETMLPGAELIDWSTHNWVTDPYSQGGVIAWKPGRLSKSHSELGAAEGALAFATADIAPKWFATIEGAVECGHKAALQTQNYLLQRRAAAVSVQG
jgi:monoamine oxidase